MDELTHVLDALSAELLKQVKEIQKCKDVDSRKTQAETIHFLSQSLCSILDSTAFAAESMHEFMDEDMMPDTFLD
jgi:hypothetical protein